MCAEAKWGVSLPEFKLRALGQAVRIENPTAKTANSSQIYACD